MNILIPVDGSSTALEAVIWTVRLVQNGLHASVVLVNVQEPANLYEMVVAHDPETIQQVSAAASAHILDTARCAFADTQVVCTCIAASGDPAHALLEAIEQHHCDLVVMGASPHGSVSRELLHAAQVPVMLVKPHPAL